ncbi:hypothetical protein ES702_05521 [subsurface metagenome]
MILSNSSSEIKWEALSRFWNGNVKDCGLGDGVIGATGWSVPWTISLVSEGRGLLGGTIGVSDLRPQKTPSSNFFFCSFGAIVAIAESCRPNRGRA